MKHEVKEYLVLMGIILLVALITIVLVGFLPGVSDSSEISARGYWGDQAYPFKILNYDYFNNELNIEIQNVQDKKLAITKIMFGDTVFEPNDDLVSQEKVNFQVPVPDCQQGNAYSLNVTIEYTGDGNNTVQDSDVPLIGKCK